MKDRSKKPDIEAAALMIARCPQIDNYTLWRITKNVGYDRYRAMRASGAIPIELVRLHLTLSRAQELRCRKSA